MINDKREIKTHLFLSIWISLSTFIPIVAHANPTNFNSSALKAHNEVRAKDNQLPLKWSNDLQQISQQWANQLASRCTLYHHKGNIPFGENLFISTWPTNIVNVVNSWANEKRFYNYQQNRCQPGKQCGHYTQIVWKGTTDVGCGKQMCANGSHIFVCSYFPAGNVVGARPF